MKIAMGRILRWVAATLLELSEWTLHSYSAGGRVFVYCCFCPEGCGLESEKAR